MRREAGGGQGHPEPTWKCKPQPCHSSPKSPRTTGSPETGLQSTGRLLEEQLPEMMTELLALARDKMLCPSESMLTRSLLLEVIELHANNWNPLMPTITQYYNKTIQKLTA
ncbi:CBP80/20-dependent translation initiation factor [Turdus rufiventris]|nr:CBP80/20-dependent translation initiation factor [Turdus rufiventris]